LRRVPTTPPPAPRSGARAAAAGSVAPAGAPVVVALARAALALAALALAALAAAPGRAGAQTTPAPPAAPARAVRLAVENDLFALRGGGPPPDYDYTHGTRVDVTWADAPAWARRLAGRPGSCRAAADRARGCLTAAASLAQEIYTPRRDAPTPVPGERPYAAWLAAEATLAAVAPGRTRAASLAVGTTGPPALGGPVQNGAHHLLGSVPQQGWPRQLAARLGVQARYEAVRWAERPLGRAAVWAVRLRGGAALGTVTTGAGAGADLVVGRRAALPWSPAAPEIERPARAYARLGAGGDLVLRSAFVEGWRAGEGAARRPWVPRAEFAVGVRWRGGAAEYRHVARGREYRAQPGAHAFGALAVTLHRRGAPPGGGAPR
jgi:hypothetical protein